MLLALLLAGTAAWLAWQLREASARADAAGQKLEQTQRDLAQARAQLDGTRSDLSQKEQALATQTSESETTKSSLLEAESRAAALDQELSALRGKSALAEEKLGALLEALGPEHGGADIQAAVDNVTQLRAREGRLRQDLDRATGQITKLQDAALRRKTGQMPMGLKGKVSQVDANWNFVVIDLGAKDGVVENGTFWIYRGAELVGRVRVASTEETTCIADILPQEARQPIQTGDEAIN